MSEVRMKVVHGIHNDKPTIIINDRIINGCCNFTIEQLQDISSSYHMTDRDIALVRREYANRKSTGLPLIKFIDHPHAQVRRLVAYYGEDVHRDVLLNDRDTIVRETVAKCGTDNHRTRLVDDASNSVRAMVARCGTDQHRTTLLDKGERDPDVLLMIARFGSEDVHLHLLRDTTHPGWRAKHAIAAHGNDRTLDMLIDSII